MRALSCPTCSGVVSPAAQSCPHCGHPFQPAKKSVASGVFWGLFLFFIVLPIVVMFGLLVLGSVGVAFSESAKKSRDRAEQETVEQARRESAERDRKAEAEREAARLAREAYERTPEGIAERERDEASRRESLRIEQEAQARLEAQRQEERERPARERAAKVAAYQLTQASNGLPSFQIEVAKRYLKGDGLPQDTALATHWLKSACTNHDSTASNLLSGIRK